MNLTKELGVEILIAKSDSHLVNSLVDLLSKLLSTKRVRNNRLVNSRNHKLPYHRQRRYLLHNSYLNLDDPILDYL
ncbi:hypothetical protein CR513_35993, partial [Mucuna pruriens]